MNKEKRIKGLSDDYNNGAYLGDVFGLYERAMTEVNEVYAEFHDRTCLNCKFY